VGFYRVFTSSADYEFKHLLKICEHKLGHKKDRRLSIDVVLFDSETTAMRYKSFFGNKSTGFLTVGL